MSASKLKQWFGVAPAILVIQFAVSPMVHAQSGARSASPASGQTTLAGSNGPAAILALPPSNGSTQRTLTAKTSSKSGTSAKIMPVRRPGTTGQ